MSFLLTREVQTKAVLQAVVTGLDFVRATATATADDDARTNAVG
jgi:hypothetical protein